MLIEGVLIMASKAGITTLQEHIETRTSTVTPAFSRPFSGSPTLVGARQGVASGTKEAVELLLDEQLYPIPIP